MQLIQSHVHLATPEDMLELGGWLYSNDSIFEYNFPEIQDEFQNNRVLVLTVTKNNIPEIVGFCSMNLDYSPHFFEIQDEFKGLGFGKQLFKAVMDMALSSNISEMTIQCSPRESYSFWSRQGFEKISDDGINLMAYRKLEKCKKEMGWENSQPILNPSTLNKPLHQKARFV